jgi:hypothetical protein
VPDSPNQVAFDEPVVLWRMARVGGLLSHAVIGPTIIRPVSNEGADDMTRTLALTVTLVLLGFAGLQPAYVTSGQADFKTILDGTSMKGWNVVGNANWTVADGAVQATMGTGFLVTPMSYTDFQITADFWVTDDANSGIFIRCDDPKTITATNSYEVNIYDKRPDQSYRTGGIVDVAKPLNIVNTGGKWNTIDITARGPRLTVLINGQKMVDVQDAKHPRGPIALQYGAGTVKFKNVKLRTL